MFAWHTHQLKAPWGRTNFCYSPTGFTFLGHDQYLLMKQVKGREEGRKPEKKRKPILFPMAIMKIQFFSTRCSFNSKKIENLKSFTFNFVHLETQNPPYIRHTLMRCTRQPLRKNPYLRCRIISDSLSCLQFFSVWI